MVEIKDFPNYYITQDGQVISTKGNGLKPHVLKNQIQSNGYIQIQIYNKEGKKRGNLIHRLVAEAFIPNPNNLPEVHHIDKDLSNNNVSNLEWRDIKSNRSIRDMSKCETKIVDTNTGIIYDSLQKASKKTLLSPGCIGYYLKVNRGWKYL